MYTAPKQPVPLPLSSLLHVTWFKPLQKEGYICLDPGNPSDGLSSVADTYSQGQTAGQAEG